MMRFLHTIRKTTIDQGKIKKYLFYAFGEIVLVVAGILIALSINNWNNHRIERVAELRAYENVKNQILDEKKVVLGVIDYNNTYLKQFKAATQIIETNDRSKVDTLVSIALGLFRYSDYNRSGTVYQNLVNSGELKLLKNDNIINGIRGLEESYIYMNRLEENHFDVILRFVGPGIIDNIKFLDMKAKRPEELYSLPMQNLFVSFISIMMEKDVVYLRTLSEIDAIIAVIDQEMAL